MINPVNNAGSQQNANIETKKTVAKEEQLSKKESAVKRVDDTKANVANEKGYVVELGKTPEKNVTYTNKAGNKANVSEMERLKAVADEALKPLRSMVEELLKKQGIAFKDTNFKANQGKMVEIDEETRAEASRLISDGGEYSVENTAQRIVDFAVAVSGDDKSKFEELKSAIMEGFKAAEEAFGGELPEISHKTINLTMEKLEAWSKKEQE